MYINTKQRDGSCPKDLTVLEQDKIAGQSNTNSEAQRNTRDCVGSCCIELVQVPSLELQVFGSTVRLGPLLAQAIHSSIMQWVFCLLVCFLILTSLFLKVQRSKALNPLNFSLDLVQLQMLLFPWNSTYKI